MDLRGATSTLYDADGGVAETVSFPDFQRNQLFLDEVSHFLGCIARNETPLVSGAEGLCSLTVALAAKASLS